MHGVVRYFEEQESRFKKLSSRVSRQPSGEALHKLRVATRRLRTVLWLLENGSPPLRFKSLDGRLHKLSSALGKTRELDVAIQDALKYKHGTDSLKDKRSTKRRRVRKRLTSRKRQKLLRGLRDVRKTLQAEGNTLDVGPALDSLRHQMDHWTRVLDPSDKNLHRLRIDVKKARYTIEATCDSDRPTIERLTRLQDMLGRIHDLSVLEGLVGETNALERDLASLRLRIRQQAPATLKKTLRNLEAA